MTIEIYKDGGMSITGDSVDFYRMAALKGALSLELKGLKRRGPSAFSMVKREYGLKGNKQKVYEQFCKLVEEASAKQVRVQKD